MPFILTETDKYKAFDGAEHKALKALFQNSAIQRVIALSKTDLTNSSGGTADAGGVLDATTVPTANYYSAATDKAPKAGFDAAIAAIFDGHVVISEWLNAVRTSFGLDTIDLDGGTPAISGTVGAITSALTAVSGTTVCVDDATGIEQIENALVNQAVVAHALNECLNAVGSSVVVSDANNVAFTPLALNASAATGTGVAGTTTGAAGSLSDAQVDAALGTLKDNISTMATLINDKLGGQAVAGNPLKGVYVG